MKKKYAAVAYVDFKKYKRIIVMSDIHGDLDGFTEVLDKVRFSKEDALVIVGDILEKGAHSLELLHLVMQYVKAGNTYMVAGNNDVWIFKWFDNIYSDEDILWYVNAEKRSILVEMMQQLNMKCSKIEDVQVLKNAIEENFSEEIDFLAGLPHIMESDIATFVHAGIRPGGIEEQDIEYCLAAPAFASQTYCFEKPVIVGHWPVSNYCGGIIDVNPYFNKETNVIGIDGGNSMKSWQQINYLIFDNEKNEISNGYYDCLPQIKVLESRKLNDNPVSLIFPNTLIEIREETEDKCVCYIPYLDKQMEIERDNIYTYKGRTYCADFTTYCLPVEAGEVVAYCEKVKDGILIKRDGIVGKYIGRYEFMNGE